MTNLRAVLAGSVVYALMIVCFTASSAAAATDKTVASVDVTSDDKKAFYITKRVLKEGLLGHVRRPELLSDDEYYEEGIQSDNDDDETEAEKRLEEGNDYGDDDEGYYYYTMDVVSYDNNDSDEHYYYEDNREADFGDHSYDEDTDVSLKNLYHQGEDSYYSEGEGGIYAGENDEGNNGQDVEDDKRNL